MVGEFKKEETKGSGKGVWIFLGVVVLILIGGYFMFNSEDRRDGKIYSGEVDKVTFGVEISLLPAVVWVSENKDYFKEEGLDLTMKEFSTGRDSFLDMLDGGVDISMVAPTPPMYASFSRDDFYFFSTFAYSDENIKVIANKESGINSAEDLIGKKIGTPKGTTGDFYTDAFLIFNSVPTSEVEIINIAPSNLPNALAVGDVDAVIIWEPHASNSREILGNKAIQLESSEVYRDTFNFMVMKEFANNNPQVLEKFLRAIEKAIEFTEENKEESQEIVASRIGVKKETIEELWDEYTFENSLDQSFLIAIESEARWAVNNNLTDATEIPNYLNYIYTDALEKIDESRITIIN